MAKVHDVVKIPKELLFEHPRNSNEQSRHEFGELRQSIRENGFDENIIVVPKEEEDGYWIVSGNHRVRAGVAEGLSEFPAVVHDDWDSAKEQIELIRRNVRRGSLNKDKFTVAVNALAEDSALSLDSIREEMGFEDVDEFLKLYNQQEQSRINDAPRETSPNAGKVKMIDDLGLVLSGILERYGDTVDKSFIVFPAGGRNHMYIAATPALKRMLELVAQKCITEHIDINLVLGGLLVIGMDNAQFKTAEADVAGVLDAGTEEGSDEL